MTDPRTEVAPVSGATDLTIVFMNPVPSDDPVFREHRIALERWAETATPGGAGVELVLPDRGQEALVTERLPDARVLVIQDGVVDEELLSRATSARLIHVIGTQGARIDVSAAVRHGVEVAVVPHYGCVIVAEHSLMLMLALVRKLVPLHARAVQGDNPRGLETIVTTQWKRHFNWLGLPDDELGGLYGRTLGILGLGEIGAEVASRARAFGMEVLYNKRTRLPPAEEERRGVTYMGLEEMLGASDVLSVHCSHNEATHKLLDRSAFSLMKPGALLINTARGGIVDTEALVEALETGSLAGAGLDVFEMEPLDATSPLTRMDNVVLSPHVAARAPVLSRYSDLIENLERLVRGEPAKGSLRQVAAGASP